jgi:hypothetical protein
VTVIAVIRAEDLLVWVVLPDVASVAVAIAGWRLRASDLRSRKRLGAVVLTLGLAGFVTTAIFLFLGLYVEYAVE